MIRRPPRSTRTDTLFPYTTLFRSGRASISSRLPRTAWNWQQGLAVAVIVGDVERSGPDRRIRSCDVKRRGEARVAIPERVAKFFVEIPTDVLAVEQRGFQCAPLALLVSSEDRRVGRGCATTCISRWSAAP